MKEKGTFIGRGTGEEVILVNGYPMQRGEQTGLMGHGEHSRSDNPSATVATDYQFMKDFPE